MGPYGSGLAYYGKYFDQGKPIEESWINRKGSDDFSNLINYQEEYAKYAKRYSVGQQSNFINVEMLNEGIKQLNTCLLYTSPSPRDKRQYRMPSSA